MKFSTIVHLDLVTVYFLGIVSASILTDILPAAPLSALPNFNLTIANATVGLSAVAYCDPDTYTSHTFKLPNTGFVPFTSFNDSKTDMHGYVGYNTELQTIFVVYRGTELGSATNFYHDFQVLPVLAGYENCPTCYVHKGFKACHDNTFPTVLAAVANLTSALPNYRLVVTGHSLGGATATLSSVALELAGYKPMLYSIGAPRVGNSIFATYVSSLFPIDRVPVRITHNRDMIPHLPFELLGYQHVGIEIFETVDHKLLPCIGSDDNNCKDQYNFFQTNNIDHLFYFNRFMLCE